ncbi:MAG: hypothetical protein IBJ18_04945 [Phycisphaerales bacterium]|nr:hypothetical protein [Phycisphaerales bacterium]
MLAKVLFLILCIGASACVLLTVRQQRLAVVHDMAAIHNRLAQHDKVLFDVRARIAQDLSPMRVQQLASAMGPLSPIGVDPVKSAMPDTKVMIAKNDGAKPASGGGRGEVASSKDQRRREQR